MAHRILGIDIGSTEIKAVLVETTWRNTVLLGVYREPTPNPAECAARTLPPPPTAKPGDESPAAPGPAEDETPPAPAPSEPPPPWVFGLSDLLNKHKLEYNEVHCALPASKTTTRIMTLPFDSRRRLEQVLPFELENVVPFDLDEMHLSFEVLGKDPAGGFRVLITLTPKQELERHLRNLALVGVDPRVVDVSSYALFAASKQFLPDALGAYATLDLGATHADLAVLSVGELLELRSLPFGAERFDAELAAALRIDPARAEQVKRGNVNINADDAVGRALRKAVAPLLVRLRQTIQGIHSEHHIEITRLYLTGRGALLHGLDAFLADELGVEVEWLKAAAEGLPISASPEDPAEESRFAAPLALVNRGLGALRRVNLNLRHGLFVYKRQQMAMQTSLRNIAVVGGLVLLLVLYNVIAGQVQKRRQYAALQNQMIQLYMKAFPGSTLAGMQPLDQFRTQIAKTMAKQKTTGFFGDANLRAIDILEDMSKVVPPNITVDVMKFDLAQDSLKIEGEVAGYPDVDNLEKSLEQIAAFKQVKKDSANLVASGKVRFRFIINLLDVRKQKAGAMTPGRPPVPGAPAAPSVAPATGAPPPTPPTPPPPKPVGGIPGPPATAATGTP